MINPVYVYIFGPPVAALGFLGAMWVSSSRRTKALDDEIAAFRAQEAAKLARANEVTERPAVLEGRLSQQSRLIADELGGQITNAEILTSMGGHGGVVIVGMSPQRLRDFRKAKSAGIRVRPPSARLPELITGR